jgi:predicted transcriptional regulator
MNTMCVIIILGGDFMKEVLTVRLEPELIEKIENLALEGNLSQWVRLTIKEKLENDYKKQLLTLAEKCQDVTEKNLLELRQLGKEILEKY